MNILFEIPDVLIIGVIAAIVLVIIIVAFFIRARHRKIKPISEDERYDSDDIKEEIISEISEDDMTDEQLEAKAELEKVYQRMSEDLEKQHSAPDEIEDFERQQEENAIISYQELVKQYDRLKEEADTYEKVAEDKADMKVTEAIETYRRHDNEKKNNLKHEKKKSFKSSDIVSPIYGVQSNKAMFRQKSSTKSKKSDIISKAYKEKEFDEEKTQNIDFLNSLKEFRKNL